MLLNIVPEVIQTARKIYEMVARRSKEFAKLIFRLVPNRYFMLTIVMFSDSYLLMRAPLDSLKEIFELDCCEDKPFFPVSNFNFFLLLLTSQLNFTVSV